MPDRELVAGMRLLGFIVGRNPDGVDDSVAATLLVVRDLQAELDRLRAVEGAAQEFVDAHQATDWAWTERMDAAFQSLRVVLAAAPGNSGLGGGYIVDHLHLCENCAAGRKPNDEESR